MNIISIIGIIAGLILSVYGTDELLKVNWVTSDLPINSVLIVAFGVFLFLFSLSTTRTRSS